MILDEPGVLKIRKSAVIRTRKYVSQKGIEPHGVGECQFGHRVDAQRLHYQLRFRILINFLWIVQKTPLRYNT